MLTFRPRNAVTAEQFETQGNQFSPDIHIIQAVNDAVGAGWTQHILDKYADKVVAYHIVRLMDGLTFSIELQFASSPEGRASARTCLKEYRGGFGKGGFVPKRKKLANAKPESGRRPRLLMKRMYRLPNGEFFWYFARWDHHGNVAGKVESFDCPRDGGIPLENKIIHRSELEHGELIPKGQEPWTL